MLVSSLATKEEIRFLGNGCGSIWLEDQAPTGHRYTFSGTRRITAGQPQYKLQWHLPCLQLLEVRQALHRGILLPLQPALLAVVDDLTDRQCGLLQLAFNRLRSQNRGRKCVIKPRLGKRITHTNDGHVHRPNSRRALVTLLITPFQSPASV